MKIFVASYTYIYEHSYKVFDYFKKKDDLFFILPKKWKSTKGTKITAYPKMRDGFEINTASAPFYHSRYPLIRGHLKGWMPALGRILKKYSQRGDILYSSYEPNLFVTYLYSRLARRLGLKHVFFTWQNVPYRQRLSGIKLKITEWLLKENFRLSHGGLFGMGKAFEIHEPYLKYNPDLKYEVIPQTGVNTDIFRPDISSDFRKKYNLEGKILFLFAATFTERKGVISTIKAFSKIAHKFSEVHLVLIGTGNLESQIHGLIGDFHLKDRTIILPWQPVDELASFYVSADVFVHPSEPFEGWEEQFGLLILQAQACGTPVITSKTGSLEESVLNGKTGILVEPGNAEEIAAAMELLAENNELRKKLGHQARDYMINHFSNQSVAKRLEKYFQSL